MEPDCRVRGRNALIVCLCAMREIKRKFGIVFLVLIASICFYYAVVKENDYMLKMCFELIRSVLLNNVTHTL